MKAVNYLVKESESQTNEVNSFIGGKPKLPTNMEIPKCKVCGEELVFMFQIAFPKGHSWYGKSMAVFMCITGDAEHELTPQMADAEGYDDTLNMEIFHINPDLLDEYENSFRVIIFDTELGVMCGDYDEKLIYKDFELRQTEEAVSDEDFVVAGEPIWIMGMNETPMSICGDLEVQLLLQVKEDYIFDKCENAPDHLDSLDMDKGYSLFVSNRIYFWGNSDMNNPRVYISVQRP